MDYNSLTLAELREIARSKQLKNVAAIKKAELVELLTQLNEKEAEEAKEVKETKEAKEVKNVKRQTVAVEEVKKQGVKKLEQKPVKNIQRFEAKNENRNTRPGDSRMNRDNRLEKPVKSVSRSSDTVTYDARTVKADYRVEQISDSASTSRSVNIEVQEAPVYESERVEEKKNINVRNEAFTLEEFLKIDNPEIQALDSRISVNGILEIMEGYGFIRSANYLPGENDVYVSPMQIRRFNLKTGDILKGNTRVKTQSEKFSALLYIESVNGFNPLEASRRRPFEELTPIFPDEKISLEQPGAGIPMRITDIIAPIGKGQRGMIVSPPKAGKTTLLKQIAKTISRNYKDMHMLVLLIDERPEEVTDIRESIEGPNVEVIYSTFDELPEHHKRVAEMVLERAKRLVEHKKDVVILLDSITRLARAYNLIVPPSGRTLTGGLDPAALHMPKKFFGAARNIREGGSLTILATALVETGSKMDDVVFEEFKGTGNMELVLDRKLSEKRIFPAIDIAKSSTRRDDLLLTKEEQDTMYLIRREFSGAKGEEAIEEVLRLFARTNTNSEFIQLVQKSLGRR